MSHEQQSDQPNQVKEQFSPKLAFILASVHLAAIYGIFAYFSWQNVLVWFCAHIFFGTFGMVLGQHRYFSHTSFTPTLGFKRFMAVVATLCFQGGPIFWAAIHRAHHKHSESYGDPHSATRGFWWSHMGWMFYLNPNGFAINRAARLVPDLLRDRFLVFLEKYSVTINVAVMLIGALIASAIGRLDLYYWIFPIRILTVWHVVWLTNSFYHGASFSPNKPPKGLRNNILNDFLMVGEGSHKNHHEQPALPWNSRAWYQLDFGFAIIRLCKALGLIKAYRGETKSESVDPSVEKAG